MGSAWSTRVPAPNSTVHSSRWPTWTWFQETPDLCVPIDSVKPCSAEQALRAHQRRHHDEPELQRMGQRLRRRQDDHSAAGPAHAPLPYPRDRQRQLPVQEQLSSTHHQEGVQTEEVTHHLSPRGSNKGGSGLDGNGGSLLDGTQHPTE